MIRYICSLILSKKGNTNSKIRIERPPREVIVGEFSDITSIVNTPPSTAVETNSSLKEEMTPKDKLEPKGLQKRVVRPPNQVIQACLVIPENKIIQRTIIIPPNQYVFGSCEIRGKPRIRKKDPKGPGNFQLIRKSRGGETPIYYAGPSRNRQDISGVKILNEKVSSYNKRRKGYRIIFVCENHEHIVFTDKVKAENFIKDKEKSVKKVTEDGFVIIETYGDGKIPVFFSGPFYSKRKIKRDPMVSPILARYRASNKGYILYFIGHSDQVNVFSERRHAVSFLQGK